jgi:hypothetical protein
MAAFEAAGIAGNQVAAMLNALGSSHISFEVSSNTQGALDAIKKAKTLFADNDIPIYEDYNGKSLDDWIDYF